MENDSTENPFRPPEPNPVAGNEQAKSATENANDVANSASTLVAKHRKQRADKGQPRAKRVAQPDVQASPVAPIDPLLVERNLKLVKDCIVGLSQTVDGIVTKTATSKAVKLGCKSDDVQLIQDSIHLQDKEAEIIGECSASIVARSELLTRYAPEAMLAMTLTSYSVRIVTVFRRLDALEAALKKAQADAKAV